MEELNNFLPEDRYSLILKESDDILLPNRSIGMFVQTLKTINPEFRANHSLKLPLEESCMSYSVLKDKYYLHSTWSLKNATDMIASTAIARGIYGTLIGSTSMDPPKAEIAYSLLVSPIKAVNIETSVSTFDHAVGCSVLLGQNKQSSFGCELYYLPKGKAGGVSFGLRRLYRSNTLVLTYTPIIGQVSSSIFKPLVRRDNIHINFASRLDANLFSYDSNIRCGFSVSQKMKQSRNQNLTLALGHLTGLSLSYSYNSGIQIPSFSINMNIPFQWSRLEKFFNQKPTFAIGVNIEL
eukprot:NODE_345_length_10548_cov_0.306728.p3 type:complete len:295 gc:universal NODE_345_length_10548_cov_0.306728:3471-2587(-)